jgi:hypothetical protein
VPFNESKRSIKRLGNIDDAIPVIIISSTEMEKKHPLKEDWYTNQKQWLNKNPRSKIIQMSSEHFIQLKKPQEVCSELKKALSFPTLKPFERFNPFYQLLYLQTHF